MIEEERRQEVLMAEETIRRLGKEMARASGMANQAEAAREKLGEANAAIHKAIQDLQIAVSTQRVVTGEAIDTLEQAKKSLEDATKTLSDANENIDGIEANITEAVNEIKAASKIMETSPSKFSMILSRELSEADKKNEELHNESMRVLKDNSERLQSTAKAIEDNNGKLYDFLSNGFLEAEKQADVRHNASIQILENNLKELDKMSRSQLSGILSLLRLALAAAVIGAVASIIALFINFMKI